MEAKHHIHERYEAQTVFGKEVAKSNFGRVCPRCAKWWANREQWKAETDGVKRIVGIVGAIEIRAHKNCGGQMAIGTEKTQE